MWFHTTNPSQMEVHLGLLLAPLGLLSQLLGPGLNLGRQVCAETLCQYLQWSQEQCNSLYCIVLQYCAVHSITVQFNAVQCIAIKTIQYI